MAASRMSAALGLIVYWLLMYVNVKGNTCVIKKDDNLLIIAVRNGSCVVYNWKEMICMWDLNAIMFETENSPENKSTGYQNTSLSQSTNVNFNHVDYDVKLEWTVFNRFSLCPNRVIEEHCLTCRFSENDGNDSLRIDFYTFRLQINNTRRNISKTSEWMFDTGTLVQPDRVYDLTVIPNKTDIVVHWKHEKSYFTQKYKIQYKSCQDKKWKRCKSRQPRITLRNLKPFTNYTIRVRSIPMVDGKKRGYWSEPEVTVTQTLEDVPSDVPELLPGYYMCCSENCSCVQLLWKPIREADRNGHITAHRLTIENEYVLRREQLIVPGNSTSAVIDVDSDSTNVIRLTQRTSIGYPNIKDASITLPPTNDRPSLPKNILVEAFDPAHIRISWDIPIPSEDNVYLDNATVVICKTYGENVCQTIVKSFTQPLVNNHFNIRLPEGSYKDYVFGVSVESQSHNYGGIISSGIQWSDCTYQKGGVSTKPLTVHLVMDSMYHNAMGIRWKRYDCSESVGFVQNYVLFYCVSVAGNCTESHSVSIDRSKTGYKMKNLSPGKYRVWLNAKFSGGLGPESEVLIFHISGKEIIDEIPELYILAFCLVSGFVLVVCVVVFALRKYCHSINKSLEIDIPKPYTNVARRKQNDDVPPSQTSSDSSDMSEHSPFIKPIPPRHTTLNENTTLILDDKSVKSLNIDLESNAGKIASSGVDQTSACHFIQCERESDDHIPGSFDVVKTAIVASDIFNKEDKLTQGTGNDFLDKKEDITHKEIERSANTTQHDTSGAYSFTGSIDAYVKANCTGSNIYGGDSENGCDMTTSSCGGSVDDYLKTYIVTRNAGKSSSAMHYCDVSILGLSKSTTNIVGSEMFGRKYIDNSRDYSDASL